MERVDLRLSEIQREGEDVEMGEPDWEGEEMDVDQ